MEANSLYKKTKILLAEKIQSFMFGELGEEEQIYLSEREKKVLIEFLQEDSIELIKQLEELSKDKDAL
ncbi:31353_t:CDS:2, partial [Racocetra persica]